MDEARVRHDLEARLHNLEERIAAFRAHSEAQTGVPFGGSGWADIVAGHAKLAQQLADERAHDAGTLERFRADIEALHLSFEDWLRSIDRSYAAAERRMSAQ